ncbi:Eco29kI family restriction endonuclease [Microbispora corallina]|uniref:Eco29kI family restriction endonuclease n=1 Tax=Microbispora corallina TaxID=83302 RepID=UPI001951F301|nr:Eco29kI family restriction endonuclease [Microbispora corallina]
MDELFVSAGGYLPEFFDPMSTDHVSWAICRELERQPLVMFEPEIPRFNGSGLYAIYYRGASVGLYEPLVPYKIPIYVGQAESHNSATGRGARTPDRLWKRISGHKRSIIEGGLPIEEFGVRLLRLPDVHANLGENALRVNYLPVWNAVLPGFGSNEQGSSTRRSARTKWDTVHQGRSRTYGDERYDRQELIEAVEEHIAVQISHYDEAPWRE